MWRVRQRALETFTPLRSLRASLHETLTGQPLPQDGTLDEIPEKISIVATELATNAIGGLGLQLARRLALDVGWYVDGVVKHVWAEFPIGFGSSYSKVPWAPQGR
jgi:hypothetical protein